MEVGLVKHDDWEGSSRRGDTNGDGKADLRFQLDNFLETTLGGAIPYTLAGSDFVLSPALSPDQAGSASNTWKRPAGRTFVRQKPASPSSVP